MTFKTFTRKKFYKRGNPVDAPVGVFAEKIQSDKDFPMTSSVDKLITYFQWKDEEAKDAFVTAISEYITEKLKND